MDSAATLLRAGCPSLSPERGHHAHTGPPMRKHDVRHRTWISLLFLLGISAVSGGWGPSGGPSKPKPPPHTQVIQLLWVRTSTHATRGRSSWTSRLENETPQFGKPAGATVGSELGFSDGYRTSGAIRLPGGVLEFGGPVKPKGNLRLAITGGAGAFAGATGSYSRRTGTRALLLLQVRYR